MPGIDIPGTLPAAGPQAGGAASVIAGANPYGAAATAAAGALSAAMGGAGPSSGSDGSIADRSGKGKNVISNRQRNVDNSINFGSRTSGSQSSESTTTAKASAEGGSGGDTRGKPPEDGKKPDAAGLTGATSGVSMGGISPLFLAAFAVLGLVAAFMIGRR